MRRNWKLCCCFSFSTKLFWEDLLLGEIKSRSPNHHLFQIIHSLFIVNWYTWVAVIRWAPHTQYSRYRRKCMRKIAQNIQLDIRNWLIEKHQEIYLFKHHFTVYIFTRKSQMIDFIMIGGNDWRSCWQFEIIWHFATGWIGILSDVMASRRKTFLIFQSFLFTVHQTKLSPYHWSNRFMNLVLFHFSFKVWIVLILIQ